MNCANLQGVDNTPNKMLDGVSERCLYSETVKRKSYRTGEVVEMLKKKQGDRSLRQFASDLGISAPYLSDIYKGHRRPGKAVLSELGLTAKTAPPPEPVYEAV